MVVTTGVSVERPNYHPAAPMGRVTGSHLGLTSRKLEEMRYIHSTKGRGGRSRAQFSKELDCGGQPYPVLVTLFSWSRKLGRSVIVRCRTDRAECQCWQGGVPVSKVSRPLESWVRT